MEGVKGVISKRVSINIFSVFKYSMFFILFYLLGIASINGSVKPFMFGMLFALAFNKQKVIYLVPLYIIASYLGEFTIDALTISVCTCLTLLVFYFLHTKFKVPANKFFNWHLCNA